jgi:hypothetical protein
MASDTTDETAPLVPPDASTQTVFAAISNVFDRFCYAVSGCCVSIEYLKFIPYKPTHEDLETNPHYHITLEYLQRLYSALERPSGDADPQAAWLYDEVMTGCRCLLSVGLHFPTPDACGYMHDVAHLAALVHARMEGLGPESEGIGNALCYWHCVNSFCMISHGFKPPGVEKWPNNLPRPKLPMRED